MKNREDCSKTTGRTPNAKLEYVNQQRAGHLCTHSEHELVNSLKDMISESLESSENSANSPSLSAVPRRDWDRLRLLVPYCA